MAAATSSSRQAIATEQEIYGMSQFLRAWEKDIKAAPADMTSHLLAKMQNSIQIIRNGIFGMAMKSKLDDLESRCTALEAHSQVVPYAMNKLMLIAYIRGRKHQYLDLRKSAAVIDDEVMEAISQNGENLRTLNLTGSRNWKPTSLIPLMGFGCPSLMYLNIGGCTQFNDDNFVAIAPLCRRLEYLTISAPLRSKGVEAVEKYTPETVLRIKATS